MVLRWGEPQEYFDNTDQLDSERAAAAPDLAAAYLAQCDRVRVLEGALRDVLAWSAGVDSTSRGVTLYRPTPDALERAQAALEGE
jgi:hypothetical protein